MAERNRHTNWCFTLNYGAAGQLDDLAARAFVDHLPDITNYGIVGFESAPTTNQLHLQGYIQLSSRKRLSELKRLPEGSTVHWEPARGDEVENRAYCTKTRETDLVPNAEFVEWGEPVAVNAGIREKARWTVARKLAVAGNLAQLDDQLFIQHYSAFRNIARDYLPVLPDADACTGVWYYGPTGSGKSRQARLTYAANTDDIYLKPVNKWWDGYRSQPFVLMEDFGKDHSVLGYHLKIWADRYSFPAEIKGSTIAIRPKKIVVTSQYHPRDIWQDSETLDAILRRFQLTYIGPLPNPWEADLVLPASSSSPTMNQTLLNSSPLSESDRSKRINRGSIENPIDLEPTQVIDLTVT